MKSVEELKGGLEAAKEGGELLIADQWQSRNQL